MVACIVLAAGASTRFGSPKQQLLVEPVLERVRRSSVDDVVVVLGAHELVPSAPAVRCPDWERGPGASLRCALSTLPPDVEAAVVVLADGPDLAPEAIDRVIEAWRGGSSPSCGDVRRHPPPSCALSPGGVEEIPDEGAKTLDAVTRCLRRSGPPGTSISPMVPEGLIRGASQTTRSRPAEKSPALTALRLQRSWTVEQAAKRSALWPEQVEWLEEAGSIAPATRPW